MTSWEWVAENPRCSRKVVDRLLNEHQITEDDRAVFEREHKPDADGRYDSAAVIGWLGY